jgi:hypothetical protein
MPVMCILKIMFGSEFQLEKTEDPGTQNKTSVVDPDLAKIVRKP